MSDFFDDVFTAYCNSYNECASCPLGKETGDCRDLFAKRVKEWEKAQVEMAAAETTPPTAADKDVGGKWPKWVKVGQWVELPFARDGRPYKILRVKHGEVYISNMADDERAVYYGECKPVRFMPYSYEEAVKLLGKTMEWSEDEDSVTRRAAIICDVVYHFGRVEINFNSQAYLMGGCATIDGVPFGIPEVDEDALKEGE